MNLRAFGSPQQERIIAPSHFIVWLFAVSAWIILGVRGHYSDAHEGSEACRSNLSRGSAELAWLRIFFTSGAGVYTVIHWWYFDFVVDSMFCGRAPGRCLVASARF